MDKMRITADEVRAWQSSERGAWDVLRHASDLAASVIALEAERDEARAEVERMRDIAAKAREAADDAAMRELTLEMGVWNAVHPPQEGQPPVVPSADEVIAAVRRVVSDAHGWWDWAAETCESLGSTITADRTSADLRAEVEKHVTKLAETLIAAHAEVKHLRQLSKRRAEERHEQEARAIRAERERHEAAAARDEAVFAREAAASQHRQDLLAIANALGCIDADPASIVAAARLAAHARLIEYARTGGAS